MVRDDLYITVPPSFFRCPISLDVMKSPVSLCTGVTYDRACIQRWLDGGNNTCPTTMQVLQTKDFVPNYTLQRLIHIWSDSLLTRVDSLDTSHVHSPDQIKRLIRAIEPGYANRLVDHLHKLASFAMESEENASFLAYTEGFVAMVVDLLSDNADDINRLTQVVRVLELIVDKFGNKNELTGLVLKRDGNCLSSLVLLLQQGSTDSQIASLKILESVCVGAESKLQIAEKEGLLSTLMKLISTDIDQTVIESSLSLQIAISYSKRVRLRLLKLGVIAELKNLLTEPRFSSSITEKSLRMVEMMLACAEGRIEISRDGILIKMIVEKLLKASKSATEHAVKILWSVCYLFGEEAAREAVAKSNGMTKLLLLMQSDCSASVRQMSADLLKIFMVNYKCGLSSYETKTTHIMPF